MGNGKNWGPYLEKMREQLNQLTLDEINEINGQNLTPAAQFKSSQAEGGFWAYRSEKIEKIGIGDCILNGELHGGFCTIIAKENLDLPLFISRWEESENQVSFMVDIIPTVDSLIDEPYRKKYVESVQPLWDRFVSLPGICPEESDVIRSLCSIIYTAAKVPIEKEGMRLAALAPHTEYLKSYLGFLPEAGRVENESKAQEIKRKKKAVRETLSTCFFKEVMNGSFKGAVGDDLTGLITTILF